MHGAGIEGASGEGLQACAKSRAHMNRSEDRLRAQVSGGSVASFLTLVGAWLGLGLGLRLLEGYGRAVSWCVGHRRVRGLPIGGVARMGC